MSLFTDSRPVRWYRAKWSSSSTIVRALLFTLAVAYFLSGVFLFQLAWTTWRNRQGLLGSIGSIALGLVGLLWVMSVMAAGSAEADSTPTAEASSAGDSTTTTDVVETTTSTNAAPSTTTSTVATTTTVPPTTTTTVVLDDSEPTAIEVADSDLLISLLATIPVAKEVQAGYDRALFEHWTDADGDGCDTRAEILIRDAKGSAQADAYGCSVVAGDWYSSYDGRSHTEPGALQVDHVVALKEAWDSGAHSWSPARREAFANDIDEPGALIAVTASLNQSKGQADPSNWMPPNKADWCRYLAAWVRVKAKWGLSMDESEYGRIENLLEGDCQGQAVGAVLVGAPGVVVPIAAATPTTQPKATTTTTTAPTTTTTEEAPGDGCDPSYPTICIPVGSPDLDCKDIRDRRFKVLPPDPHGFDGNDNDGLGCES